ncbi:DUF4357 domain-containing protein [Patescibacteria group bacterium]|nr:DUF4357 domain-containing protein [Patescibacteria group bacterium]
MKKDNKTIGITIRFFTNNLPNKVGKNKDKTPFWTCGNAHLEANKTKGIKPQNEIFNYFDDIPRAVNKVMRKAKLVAVEDMAYSFNVKEKTKNSNKIESINRKGIKIFGTTKGKKYNASLVNLKEVELNGKIFNSPSGAARFICGYPVDGWNFWKVVVGGKTKEIDCLRKK